MPKDKKTLDELKILSLKTTAYSNVVFDWVKYLGKTELLDHLRDFEEVLNKKIEELQGGVYFYTVETEHDNGLKGCGYSTATKAYEYALQDFHQRCMDDDETINADEEITIIKFYYNDENEMVKDSEEKHTLYFEREE